jgi:hypothetical protein
MTNYQQYVIFGAIKEFVLSLSEYYNDEVDEPVNLFNAYLNRLNISMKESKVIVNETINFCNRNVEAIKKRDISLFKRDDKGIVFDEEVFVDVVKYLQREDENSDVILDHLNTLDYLIEGGATDEEKFLDSFVSSFTSSFNSSSVDLPEFNSDESVSNESIEAIGDVIKPTIEKSLEDFQKKNLSIDGFMKSISFKVKEYVSKNEIPGLHKEELNKILDMTIENDVSELMDRKFEIFSMLSSSGLLAHLPIDKIMTLMPGNIDTSTFNINDVETLH